jgi:hypothetical protein
MAPTLADALRDWRDFYLLIGTASATLVGLMFVAASIGASLFNEKNVAPMAAFITPTVVHFAAVLFAAIVAVMPGHSESSLGGVLGFGALVGLAYCANVFRAIFRRFADGLGWQDRAFYALIPVAGYLSVAAASALEFGGQPREANPLAAIGLMVLMAAGLRNGWDMTVWLTTRANPAPPPGPGG